MAPPTPSQQRALAYAPKPFGILSFFSSGYLAYHLLFRHPEKLKRLYHRLVLGMNLAVMPLSFAYFYSTWAVPAGTPGFVGALGNVQSCTALGFIGVMMGQTIPIYYGSLGLQSFMAIRSNFKEERYVWIEKLIHLFAWIIPCALTTIVAATENINPSASGCFMCKAPRGCESDPEIACERGQDITWLVHIVGMGQVFLYFIFPPLGALAIFSYIKKTQKRAIAFRSSGMQLIRESAQKKVLHNIAVQISVYLFSFWSTWVFAMISTAHQMLTGKILYNLRIISNVMIALQGCVMAMVYFTLERIGRRDSERGYFQRERTSLSGVPQLTVSDIRQSASSRNRRDPSEDEAEEPVTFHIFDGTPDENSPWAMYFDQSGDEDDDGGTKDDPADKDTMPPNDLELVSVR